MTTASTAAANATTIDSTSDKTAEAAKPLIRFKHGDWRIRDDVIEVRSNLGHWHTWGPVRRLPLSTWSYMQGPKAGITEEWMFMAWQAVAVAGGFVLAVLFGAFLTGDWMLRILVPMLIGVVIAMFMIPKMRKHVRSTRLAQAGLQCKQVMMEQGLGTSDPESMIALRQNGELPPTREGEAIFFAHIEQKFTDHS